MDVESSRLEVRAAKLNFLRAALLRDQITIAMVKDVPDKVKVLEHKKTVEHRMEQVKQARRRWLATWTSTCVWFTWTSRSSRTKR